MSDTTDNTTTQTTPPDYMAQAIALAQKLAPPSAMPSGTPDDGTSPSWTGLLGRALSGGQAPGYQLRGSQADTSGNRALLNFGINMLLASGPHASRPDLLSSAATGLQGAQESLGQDQQRAAQLAAAQQAYGQQQFQNRIAALKEALPFLTLEQKARATANAKPPWETGSGTGTGAGGAAPSATTLPPGAYGQGGPNDAPVPKELLPLYQEASARTGIPVDVLIAQGRQESGFKADAVGKAGEIGLGQIKPSTAAAPGFGLSPVDPSKLKDPRTNINFQADYLKARLPPGANPSDPAAIRAALHGYNGGGDPNYVANVTRYLPAPAPQVATGGSGAPPVASAALPGAAPPPATQFAGPGAPSGGAPGPPSPVAGPPIPASTPEGVPDTFEEYQKQHPIVVPPEIQALFKATPNPAALAVLQQQEANFRSEWLRAKGDMDPAGMAKAEESINTVRAKQAELLQSADKQGGDAQAKYLTDQTTIQKEIWQKAQDAKAARVTAAMAAQQQLDREMKLEQERGNQTRQTAREAVENAYVTDERKRFGTDRDAARTSIDGLQTLQILSDAAGKQTPLEGITLPGGITGRDLMVKMDLGTQAAQEHWGAAQAFNAAKNQMIIELRKGVSMGQLSDRDMSFLQGMGPDMMQSPDTRREILSLLENVQQQKREYIDKTEDLWHGGREKGGMDWADAKRAADKSMPKLIPDLPPGYSNLPSGQQSLWKQQHLRPGQIVRGENGVLLHYRPPSQ